ncbi:hypothetical protein JOC77_001596 [Peribacillus deserti]|uniref:Uncharacterized protein n=1 Tax=Peribacillus deserti TaxID=673318 RepID=A0ABS2QG90_9BACI|nr:hypothetical protein [Peribacillus deserti]
MKLIKPKTTCWQCRLVSERVRAIVKKYAEYTKYSESEAVDMFLLFIFVQIKRIFQ